MARSGNCPELCSCGAYCTLIHHRLLPDGRPAYHICQTCDSKTADVAENLNVDDPTKELLHAAFDVPAMLQRRGYEKSGSEQAWYKVFRREPTDLDLMIEVKRRGMGGEASEGDIVYDITLYDYPVHENPEKHWRPFVYRYARNNAQIERVLKILETRIRANNLRGVRNDESLPVAPMPPEDDPEQVIKSHEKGLLLPELERLGFTPRREQGVETLYGEDIQRYWYKTYRAPDGKGHALSVFFFGGQTPEVYASTYNFDTKVWIKGDERPNSPAQSQAGFSAIIRDLDDAMQRSIAVSLPFDQETEMMRRVMAHHRRWWDDTLDYLVRQGGIPGRMGPGQPA